MDESVDDGFDPGFWLISVCQNTFDFSDVAASGNSNLKVDFAFVYFPHLEVGVSTWTLGTQQSGPQIATKLVS
jgi:hypothetical protein